VALQQVAYVNIYYIYTICTQYSPYIYHICTLYLPSTLYYPYIYPTPYIYSSPPQLETINAERCLLTSLPDTITYLSHLR
jgi:hypothetical protein